LERKTTSRHAGLSAIAEFLVTFAPCGLRVVRIDPLRFLAGCHTRRL